MHQLIYLFCFILSFISAGAQHLSAFSDYKNYFHVFDNGTFKELEYLPVKWYKIGKSNVTYLNETGDLKAYYEGEKHTLFFSNPEVCQVMDDFTAFISNGQLNVFYEGNVISLSNMTNQYIFGDSIIGFNNPAAASFKIFYKGQLSYLPDNISVDIKDFYAGDNLIAYPGEGKQLKIYYQGGNYDMGTNNYLVYQAGANTVAFFDHSTQEFKVFHKGKVTRLESIPPQSCKVGDDMVVYVSTTGIFKVFYQGEIMELSSFAPESYEVDDHILVYGTGNNFNVFYKTKNYQLENYIPQTYKIDASTVVYKDLQGRLKAFSDGSTEQVSKERIEHFDLSGNTVKFINSLNETRFFLQGKFF